MLRILLNNTSSAAILWGCKIVRLCECMIVWSQDCKIARSYNLTILQSYCKIVRSYNLTILQSYNHALIQSYNLTILQSYNLTIIQSYNPTILQSYNLTIIQSYNLTMLQSYNFAILQSYNHTILRFYNLTIIQSYNTIRFVNMQFLRARCPSLRPCQQVKKPGPEKLHSFRALKNWILSRRSIRTKPWSFRYMIVQWLLSNKCGDPFGPSHIW
jgi:hypothetical protein